MPNFVLRKRTDGLYEPDTERDTERSNKLCAGDFVLVESRKQRNIRFHRKFFAMLKVVFDNQDIYDNEKDLLIEMKLKTGHYDLHVTTKGLPTYIPRSISFEKMDELSFSEFYDSAIDVSLKLLHGLTRAE